MPKLGVSEDIVRLILIEYQECNAGYNSRDVIVQEEFHNIVQVFSVFITIIIAFNAFIKTVPLLHTIFIIIIGLAGYLSILALLIDLQSNLSCKVALRKRAINIEKILSSKYKYKLWTCINKRDKYIEEAMIKGKPGSSKDIQEPDRNIFIIASRLFIILWLGVVIVSLFWGNHFSTTFYK